MRANNLHVVDIATQHEQALTSDASDLVFNGKADWVYYEEVFDRGLMILPDDMHSQTEQRFRGIGYGDQGRALFMHKKKIEHYEKTYRA